MIQVLFSRLLCTQNQLCIIYKHLSRQSIAGKGEDYRNYIKWRRFEEGETRMFREYRTGQL